MNDSKDRPRVTDAQLIELRSWGATHRQIAAMVGLQMNTVSVRLSRINRATRGQSRDASRNDSKEEHPRRPVAERVPAVAGPSRGGTHQMG